VEDVGRASDCALMIVDMADPANLKQVLADSRHAQLQDIAIGVPETLQADCRDPYKSIQVIDVKNPRAPRVIGLFPRPKPPEEAP
jgi:hypothetical protein